jgi:hypothetical protein
MDDADVAEYFPTAECRSTPTMHPCAGRPPRSYRSSQDVGRHANTASR